MINWLLVLILILPFLYSEIPLDTVVSVRYIFLCGFMLLFVLYFFAWKKRLIKIPSGLIKIVFISGVAFAVWSLLSLTAALNYREGYWEIGRHLLHLVLLFIIMTAVAQEPAQLLKICCAVTIISLLHGLVGILQFYEIAFTSLPGNYKPYGFMTNRNLFGSAQAFLLPFAIYTFYAGKRSWKIVAGFALTIIVISLLLSQTRSAWLSGAAIFIVSLLLVLIFVPSQRKRWMLASFAAIAVAAALISLLIFSDKESELAKSVTERAASLTVNASPQSAADVNTSERLKMWKKTVSMIKDHPLTGVGSGNWKVVIPSYGLANTVFAKGYFAPDRVHNTYLQIASETGVPGAIFYFGMWVLIAIAGFKLIRKTNSNDKKILVILMLAGLSAVAVDSLFSFAVERIEHSVYMLLMGGIILGLYAQEAGTVNLKMQPVKNIILVPIVILILFNLFLGKKKFDFEHHLKLAIYYNDQKRFQETISEANSAKNSFFTIDITGNPVELNSGVAYKEMKNYDAALKELKTALSYSPYNNRTYNNLGAVYFDLKQYQNGIDSYKKSLQYVPEFETVLKNLAVTYYLAGDYAACIETMGKFKTEGDPVMINVLNDAKNKLATKKQ
jgi:O-antigen ligase